MHQVWPRVTFFVSQTQITTAGKTFFVYTSRKKNSVKALEVISKSAYEKCFKNWEKRWRMGITQNGDYFKGDKINLPE